MSPTFEEKRSYLLGMMECEPEKKIHGYRLRALEENQRKADTPLDYKIEDDCWAEINHVLKRRNDNNPPDPKARAKGMKAILESKFLVFGGPSYSGKTTSAIHAADAYARAKSEPQTVGILDLMRFTWGSDEELLATFPDLQEKQILIVEWLDTLSPPSTPQSIFAEINKLLFYRENSPNVGPTIITMIMPQKRLAKRLAGKNWPDSQDLVERLAGFKRVAFSKVTKEMAELMMS